MAAQDMPPPGGFAKIPFRRTYPKPLVRQSILLAIGLGLTYHGIEYIVEHKKRYHIIMTEMQEHFIAAHPFLIAEQERKFLIHLWHLREEERELMKDVPNWKLGTLYGERVFKTLPKGAIPFVSLEEWTKFRPLGEFHSKVLTPDFWE